MADLICSTLFYHFFFDKSHIIARIHVSVIIYRSLLSMRVLIDISIVSYHEDTAIVPEALQGLLQLFRENSVQVFVHPLSYDDREDDKREEQRGIILSRFNSCSELLSPPNPDEDYPFRIIIKWTGNIKDIIEDNLLYCVYRDAADFLITNRNGIHDKAAMIDIADRVLYLDEALKYFPKQFPRISFKASAPVLRRVPLRDLDLSNSSLRELGEDYSDFEQWLRHEAERGLEAWVYVDDQCPGALLLMEEELVDARQSPNGRKRLKISIVIITRPGYGVAELFIRLAVEFSISHNIDKIYLARCIGADDVMIKLIEDFGFSHPEGETGAGMFLKELRPPDAVDPLIVSKVYYPSFYDGIEVKKFIIPIKPRYHDLLFQDSVIMEDTLFDDYILIPEGNAIRKAYICNSRIKKIAPGDILLFYLSHTERSLTAVGVVEGVYRDVNKPDRIMRYIGKRTIYERWDVERLAGKGALILLFRWHFSLKPFLRYDDLVKHGILLQAPQAIMEIPHEKYLLIKEKGGIAEEYTVS